MSGESVGPNLNIKFKDISIYNYPHPLSPKQTSPHVNPLVSESIYVKTVNRTRFVHWRIIWARKLQKRGESLSINVSRLLLSNLNWSSVWLFNGMYIYIVFCDLYVKEEWGFLDFTLQTHADLIIYLGGGGLILHFTR